MDGNATLTETTLSRSLTALYAAFADALEKGKKIKPNQKESFLMDVAFSVALVAGWIEAPDTPPEPETLYFLTPEAREKYRQMGAVATVTVGGFRVPESFYDEFVLLFWHNQPDLMAAQEAAVAKLEAHPWTEEEMRIDLLRAYARAAGSPTAPVSPEEQIEKSKPASLLIQAKKALGISWEQFALMASKHVKVLEDQQLKDGILVARFQQVTKDDIYHLLRGQNVSPVKVKAIAMLLNAEVATSPLRPGGWHWNDLLWPKEHRRRGRRPRK